MLVVYIPRKYNIATIIMIRLYMQAGGLYKPNSGNSNMREYRVNPVTVRCQLMSA